MNENYILQYNNAIQNREIVVCEKVRKIYDNLARNVLAENSEYFYSHNRAIHIINFFERYLRHSKGKWGGQKIRLELWQKAMLSALFGFVDIGGKRQYNRCILIVGKKNGKSFLSSGVGLYGLTSDNEAGPEIYSVATTREQAKIIWDEARRMRNKAPALNKRIRSTISGLYNDANDGVFKPLASDANNLDGLNSHYVLMDEFQQWRNGIILYNIMADGVSAREQPLILMTSTAGTIREDIYDDIYAECEMIINGLNDKNGYKDMHTLPLIYELDKRSEWIEPNCWVKANPNLGVSKSVSYLEEKVERAKHNPAMVKNLVCKEFNIRETSSETWLTFEQLNNESTYKLEQLKPNYFIGGIDLSSTTDLTCATMLFMMPKNDNLFVNQMYWLPSEVLELRIKEDKIPYYKWFEQGWLRVSEGHKINYKDVTQWFVELKEQGYYPFKIGYDSWGSIYLVDELKQQFGNNITDPVIQGKKTMSNPMKRFAADLSAKRINYNNNPILKWNLSNAAIDVDRNDNISLCKTSNQRRRIDGVASLLDAYIALDRNYQDYINMI